MLFRKDSTLRERATVALASLQRNACAMGTLRSRIESRADFILKSQGHSDEYQELARVLELVKNGELILSELSGKMEAARFLEEFVLIINGAAESVSAIKGDVEHLVPLAESALAEMHDAISKISGGLYTPDPGPAQIDMQNSILAEATAAAVAQAPPVLHEQRAAVEPKAADASIEAKAEAELA
ncbi:hypothetical protein [Nitrososphaera viennensis]|uniref:Uncharacterized protein n=1 Tax=Nitrososphaera viennensis TaxID=1034015 RepID=A0A977IDE6_9ARCH|nr:hypothetical protein [Nitrososphaera viennensis]UVS68727.1 hypothetical protein NWT39_12575 [Nitrososphaera viennensis]